MSRRPAVPADRAAQNQQTLKTLVKVESNKTCADCKKNKHPRWASWNLGIFICIRCSGIHRGMGTHISRVKSVDLDAWTDEQLQSMLRWGNARANKYWEAKLAPGHVPAEVKIENFIRTKYDSKRWVMDGGMPDPSTLDAEGDDEVPLNVVQEKAKLDRSSSLRTTSAPAPPQKQAPVVDLFGDAPTTTTTVPAPRSSSTASAPSKPSQSQTASAAQKSTRPGESLLGFDFFGSTSSDPPPRPSSAAASTSSAGVPSRPDLKQSILSLYASAPRTSAPVQQQHERTASGANASLATQQTSGSGLEDAFGGLNFSSQPMQSPPAPAAKPSPFAALASPTSHSASSSASYGAPKAAGGSFFDPKPAVTSTFPTSPPAQQPARPQRGLSSSSGFGDFSSATSPAPVTKAPANSSNGLDDLFDFSAPDPQPAAAKSTAPPSVTSSVQSPFNLSTPKTVTQQTPAPRASNSSNAGNAGAFSMNMDPWGSNDAWATSEPTPAPKPAPAPAPKTTTGDFGGWGSPPAAPPKVTADEDFGGWESSASPVAPAPPATSSSSTRPGGGFAGGGDDLFSNVWE